MRTVLEKQSMWWFMGGLTVVALAINCCFLKQNIAEGVQPQTTGRQQISQSEGDHATEARKTAADAAAEHARFLARYIEPGHERKAGEKTVVVAVVSENGTYNRAVAAAFSDRSRSERANCISSLFTPEFVSDGQFQKLFDGSAALARQLDLAHSADMVLLAKQEVDYSGNPSLENVITANMHLTVLMAPAGDIAASQNVTLTANGAGFNQKNARALAEERLIAQIAKEPKLSFAHSSANNQIK